MCARTNNMTRDQGLMRFEVFQKVIDEFVAANPRAAARQEMWLHGFGESLVHPEFARFMRYAVDKGVNAGLSINPLMLTDDTARALIGARPAHLYFALDGHDDASFERIRGVPRAYTKSKERLLAFLAAKQAAGLKTKTTLVMIDFPRNRESIEAVREEWSQVPGLDHFMPKTFTTWDGTAPDVRELVKDCLPQVGREVTCAVPWHNLTVTWDGDVTACCLDYDKKQVVGNVERQTLAEIWNGPEIRSLRAQFIANDVTSPLCRNCDHLRQV